MTDSTSTSTPFAAGTIGELLGAAKGGVLRGVTATGPKRTLSIVQTELRRVEESEDDELQVVVLLDVKIGGKSKRQEIVEAGFSDTLPALKLPLSKQAKARAQAALEALAKSEEPVEDGLPPILESLVASPEPGSLAHWVSTRALGELQPEGQLARAGAGKDACELKLTALQLETSLFAWGMLRGTMVLQRGKEAPVEQEVLLGELSLESHTRPAPDLGKPEFKKLLAAWRGEMAKNLAASLTEKELGPSTVLPSAPIIELIELWVAKGPPGPEPVRVKVTPERLTKIAAALKPCTDAELEELRLLCGAGMSGAVKLGDHRLVFVRSAVGADQILIQPKDDLARPILVGEADPVIGEKLTVDGDGWAMRAVLAALRSGLERAKLDLPLAPPDDLELFDDEELDEDGEYADEDGEYAGEEGEDEVAEEEVAAAASPIADATDPGFETAASAIADATDAGFDLSPAGATDAGLAASTDAGLASNTDAGLADAPPTGNTDPGLYEDVPLPETLPMALRDWLRFSNVARPDEPHFDWRRPTDLINDGRTFWDGTSDLVPDLDPSEVESLKTRGIEAYHEFIRAYFDPEFKPKG